MAGPGAINKNLIQLNLLEVTAVELNKGRPSLPILLSLGAIIKTVYVKLEEKSCILVT